MTPRVFHGRFYDLASQLSLNDGPQLFIRAGFHIVPIHAHKVLGTHQTHHQFENLEPHVRARGRCLECLPGITNEVVDPAPTIKQLLQ